MAATVTLLGSVENGLMPAEKIFRVENADGHIEEVPVSSRSITGNGLLAYVIGRNEGLILVELPRESVSGRWRIWVKESSVGG